MIDTIVIYHANCPDGFASAWAVREYMMGMDPYKLIEYVPAKYGDTPPDVTDKDVYIVDFSYPLNVLLEMEGKARFIKVIDHHKTAQEALQGLDFCTFDMTRAGCVLTWETLFRGSREVPELLLYVQDRDLWKWELPQSKEVSAALSSYPLTFTSWDEIIHEKGIKELAKEGEAILRYINTKVYETANSEYSLIRMAGYLVPAVCTRHYHSEIGNKVVTDTDYPFCVTYYDDGTNSRVFSLRSLQSGADVANVAKQYGGGGHAQAAGFKMPTPAAIRLFFNNTVKLSDIEITDMKTKHALVMKTSAALNYVIENGTVKDVSNFGDETITVEGDGTLTITLKLPNNYSVTTTVPKNGWRWRK